MEINDIITIILSIVATVVSIGTFFKNEKYNKRKHTIDAYIELQSFLQFLADYTAEEIELFVVDKKSEEYTILCNCLARLEIFAIGVSRDIYDFDTVYEMSHGYLDGALRGQIEAILEKKYRSEIYYANTICLLDRMDQKSAKIK